MPELPEVETIVRGLKRKLPGLTVARVEIFRPGILGNIDPDLFCRQLEGLKLEDVRRRGKYIVFRLGRAHLVSHLRMTGKYLFFDSDDYKKLTHVRMLIHFDNRCHLVYQDVRCLGTVRFYLPQMPIEPFERLGPEPLSNKFTAKVLAEILSRTNREIKSVLIDQQKIAGIGNIYASEILFVCHIHPGRRADELKQADITQLHNAIVDVLRASVELHGTTFSDYRDVDNRQGSFQNFLHVYQRADQPCRNCGRTIMKTVQNGRSTFFCPRCQPAK